MKNYRTTITIPTEVYQKSRVRAASENKSLSRFIADILRGYVRSEKKEAPKLPFGAFSLGIHGFDRKALYDAHLKRKVSY